MKLPKYKNNKLVRGFTLIELLIVIAIIAILAAVVMVALNPAQRVASARNSRVRQDLAVLGSEAQVYATDTGLDGGCAAPGYPANFNVMCGAATFRPNGSPATPTGGTYTIAGGAANISIGGPAFDDGVNGAGFWCWRSATGQITWQAGACAP